MSEDKVIYGKPNCKHEQSTPIINLPGMVRCDECGEVMWPGMTRIEFLWRLSAHELAWELAHGITDFLLETIGHPHPEELCEAWLMEEVDE